MSTRENTRLIARARQTTRAFTYTVINNINIIHIAFVAQPGIVSINRQEGYHTCMSS